MRERERDYKKPEKSNNTTLLYVHTHHPQQGWFGKKP